MLRHLTLIFSLIFLIALTANCQCVFSAQFTPTDLFPNNQEVLTQSTHFDFFANTLRLDENDYGISSDTSTPFNNKEDLLRYIACLYDFAPYSNTINGQIREIVTSDEMPLLEDQITYISFNDCGKTIHFILTSSGLYLMENKMHFEDCNPEVYIEADITTSIKEVIVGVDLSANVAWSPEPIFETITEEVLVKEAYTVLTIEPAVYQEMDTPYFTETSTCPEATFETVTEQFLVKDASTSLNIIPSEFETVTEQVLKSYAYAGPDFYEKEELSSVSFPLIESYNHVDFTSIMQTCQGAHFTPCLETDITQIPSVDTIIATVFAECLSGYMSAGRFCYVDNVEHPATYETRTLQRLVSPAQVETAEVPAEYQTVTYQRITNKDMIDPSCVEMQYDSIAYQKLITPTSANSTVVPATYTTRTYQKMDQPGALEVTGGDDNTLLLFNTSSGGSTILATPNSSCPLVMRDCQKLPIAKRLFEESYLPSENELSPEVFYLAIVKYQKDNNLSIGLISQAFLDHLNVVY